MAHAHDRWTIVLFRGTTGNPLGTTGNPRKISVRKTTVKRVLLAVVLLAVVQVGVLSHYMVQTRPGDEPGLKAELEGLKEELSQSKEQAVGFSEAIDNMQQRVLTIQTLNEKLQVMFGLEPEKRKRTRTSRAKAAKKCRMRLSLIGPQGSGTFESLAGDGTGVQPGNPRGRDGGEHQKEAVLARATDRARTPHADPVGKSSGRTG